MPENEDKLSAAATANLINTLAAAMRPIDQAPTPRRISRYFPLFWVVSAMATVIMACILFRFTETQNSPAASTDSFHDRRTSCERVPFLDPYLNSFSMSAHYMAEYVPDDDDAKRVWQRAVDSVSEAAYGVSDAAGVHLENRRSLMARLETVDISLQMASDELQAVLEEPPPPRWHILMGPFRLSGPTNKGSLASINDRVLDAARQVSSMLSSDWKNMQEEETALERELEKQGAGTLQCAQESLELLQSQAYLNLTLSSLTVLMKRFQHIYSELHAVKWLRDHVFGELGQGSWLTDDAEMALEAVMRHNAAISASRLAIDMTSLFLFELEDWERGKNNTNKLWDRVDSQVQVFLRRSEHLESTRHAITVAQLRESLRMVVGFVQRLQEILDAELKHIMETWADLAGYYWVNLCPG